MAIYVVRDGQATMLDDGLTTTESLSGYGSDVIVVEALSEGAALAAGAAYDADRPVGEDALVLDSAGAHARLAHLGVEVQS